MSIKKATGEGGFNLFSLVGLVKSFLLWDRD